jgi:Nuclease-related domain
MSRLIPKVAIDEIALKPERDVARALVEQLSQDCIVYHSHPWLKADRNDRDKKSTLREGEADFVVVVPSHGILILEVKGGAVEYDHADRGWYRQLGAGRKAINDPFEQARRATHVLTDQIRAQAFRGERQLPFAFGYAVVFPDCKYDGPAPPGAEPIIILSVDDLPYLGRRVPNVLREWSRTAGPKPMDKAMVDAVQKAISPAFQLLPVLFRQLEEQEEKLVRLTEAQMIVLDALSKHDRAAVEGVAGSGKTLLARAQAQRFAEAGMQTLFVCYNKGLAEWLRETQAEEYAGRITVQHFHGLCSDWCWKAKVPFAPPAKQKDKEQFWREDAANLLLEAVDKFPERFDAVIVDEGQDFEADWWVPLQEINAKGKQGVMYVFYDPAQNLFVKGELQLPEDLGQPYPLPTNCRNTRRIAATCGQILGQEVRTRATAPEGVDTRFVHAPSDGAQAREIKATLDEWIRKGNLKLSQVAILCPTRYQNSSVAGLSDAKFSITENLGEWREGEGILFSTIRAFKGLEADAILMVDIPQPDSVPYFTRADFYVGCSRAKHLLVLLGKTADVIAVA